MNTHKLHVQVGSHKFDGEGDAVIVDQHYERWLELVRLTIAAGQPAGPKSPDGADAILRTEDGVTLLQAKNGNGDAASPHIGAGDPLMQRAFAVDKAGDISLRVLPTTTESTFDTVLLLIYGYRVLKNQDDVSANVLMASVKQSGLQLDRIDRVLNTQPGMVRRGGYKRGTRYSLTNPGINRAEQTLRELFS